MAQTIVVAGQVRTIKGTSNKRTKGAPRSKRPGANNGPARMRYWASGRLRERKIKRIMANYGVTRAVASERWDTTRLTRVKR